MKGFTRALSLWLILLLPTGCASETSNSRILQEAYLGSREVSEFSRGELKEIEAGNQIHREILASFSLFTEPKPNEYVREITQLLGEVSHRTHLPYQCTILYSDKIYATAAPGGHVYITTGFINFLDNESELAGVIAHEIAELQYRNPKYSNAKKALEAMETAAGLAGGFFGSIGMLAFMGVATLNYMTDEKGLESRVIMADKKALHYMIEAGYDPQGLIDVLYKIIYADGSLMPYLVDYYNTRPVNADRLKKMSRVFQDLDLQDKSFDTRREKFLSAVAGVKKLYLPETR